MNFDEKYRFDSDYNNPDTDDDGIDDKTEIHSYTIRERARLKGNIFNPLKTDTEMSQIYPFIQGVVDKETLADVDGDGLRAENDPDSDGDGKNDGDEDLNHNGYVDRDYCIGENHCETDPYVVDFWPDGEEHENDIEIPENIVLYATDFLRLNDGVMCRNGKYEGCNIASEQISESAIILGVGVHVENVYSKGRVWLRNNAHSGTIRYFGLPDYTYTTDMQKGALGEREINEDSRLWPFAIPEISPKENFSGEEIIVKSGEEYTLFGTKSLKSLKVEAGGKLYLGEGGM